MCTLFEGINPVITFILSNKIPILFILVQIKDALSDEVVSWLA